MAAIDRPDEHCKHGLPFNEDCPVCNELFQLHMRIRELQDALQVKSIPGFDRDDALMTNANFQRLAKTFGLDLEMIYCGEQPNDMTGDPIRVGMQKINRNFRSIQTLLDQAASGG